MWRGLQFDGGGETAERQSGGRHAGRVLGVPCLQRDTKETFFLFLFFPLAGAVARCRYRCKSILKDVNS